ncbi:MAG TPA: IPT/TIG domain-containing protein [Kofleriaceae bacterium]|nr:IPT/TIG domain-containing protein [Kofleriaceae bacterium]
MTSKLCLLLVIAAGCSASDESLSVRAVSPAIGSVTGGTRITLEGTGLSSGTTVEIGGTPCESVNADGDSLSCVTGDAKFREGTVDVIVNRGGEQASLPAAFTYECPWTTSSGRRSCGAAPARQTPEQTIAAWLSQQPMACATDGAATLSIQKQTGLPAVDFRDSDFKIWVKVENVDHLASLDVWLGDASLANAFKFKLRSSQGQQWMTDGDWVSFTVPWSPVGIVGAPNRAAITDVMIRAADDGASPVHVDVKGIAAVAQPMEHFPTGVVSFTFDDNWADGMVAAPLLAAHRFAATEYAIIDTVGESDRASLADLRSLQESGWEIAVHSYTDEHHAERFPNVTATELEDDLVEARAWLMQNGFTGYDHCAYPGGSFTGGKTDVLGLARRYFASCRTIYTTHHETFPPSDPQKLRTLYVTNGVALTTVKQAIDNARQTHEWIILVFHRFNPMPTVTTEWSPADFAELVDYVAASGIKVQTVGDVLATESD